MSSTCRVCSTPIRPGGKTGLCGLHYHTGRRLPDQSCTDCGKPISRYTKSGFCNACRNRRNESDPAFVAARKAGIRAKIKNDPEHLAKMRRTLKRNFDKAFADPDYYRVISERGKVLAATVLRSPETQAKVALVRAENGRKVSETRLAWCPLKYREEYRRLQRSKRMSAAAAREVILGKVRNDELAQIAATHLSSARFYLSRYMPITAQGNEWRCGTAILTTEQLIERAMSKGWQPEKWAA